MVLEYFQLCRGRLADSLFLVLDRAPNKGKSLRRFKKALCACNKEAEEKQNVKIKFECTHTIDRACHYTPGLVVKPSKTATCKLGK